MTTFTKLLRFCTQPVCENSSLKRFQQPDVLYKRITPLGDPNLSIVPVFDQWVQEGRDVNKPDLLHIIKELTFYKRFKHALETSRWMTDRRYLPMTEADASNRLHLIYKVHGLTQAEKYYEGVSQQMKGYRVYTSLLKCYVNEKSVEKAEGMMQKLRDTRLAYTPVPYNLLMNLYHQVGNFEKLDILIHEIEKKGINGNKFTFSILLSAYAATSNSEGIDKVLMTMESDPHIHMDWSNCAVVANGYFKVGLMEKCLEMLKKIETIMRTAPRGRKMAYDYVLKMYAEIGNKDDLYRVWNTYKKNEKIINKGYMSMISSLLKFDDIEGAEKIFKEWESRGLSYDFRIPDYMINACVNNGQLKKAEALLDHGLEKGGDPTVFSWYYLAEGYFGNNKILEGVEALKKATQAKYPYKSVIKDKLLACLEFLEGRRKAEEAEEFFRKLKMDKIFSEAVHDRLLSFIKDRSLKC